MLKARAKEEAPPPDPQPQTRNHDPWAIRGLYRTARLPAYRAVSGITMSPFRDSSRETVVERTVTITIDEFRKWLAQASYHVRVAVAVAALAPKLRLAGVLGLTWHDHIDPDLRFITVRHHKTATTTKRPQVVPISEQLRVIRRDARQRTHTYVVEYRQRPIKTIRGGLRNATDRSGLLFGRATGGVTFHTLRHTAASMLAELGESEAIRKEVMGHRNIATTQKCTHLHASPSARIPRKISRHQSAKHVHQIDGLCACGPALTATMPEAPDPSRLTSTSKSASVRHPVPMVDDACRRLHSCSGSLSALAD